jgi:hypothetical protein
MDGWPELLRPVLEAFRAQGIGDEEVRRVGLSALDYPVTWITEVSEVRKVIDSFRRE